MTVGIIWFKQDLRLADNPALWWLAKQVDTLIPLYIFNEKTSWPLGGAQRWWLHQSLSRLAAQLKRHHCQLILRHGDPAHILSTLITTTQADSLCWNRCFEPALIQQEQAIEDTLTQLGVKVKTFNGFLLQDPWQPLNKQGQYYKVFTPYWRAHSQHLIPRDCYPTPTLRQTPAHRQLASDNLADWQCDSTEPDWTVGLRKTWRTGETAATKRLSNFIESSLLTYDTDRDRPDLLGTSRLSPHLHFGEISPWQIWHAIQTAIAARPEVTRSAVRYLAELGWREFSYHLLYHFPQLPEQNFRAEFNAFPWQNNPVSLRAWQSGQTGYPIVDAGMRELWYSGYMHNRVRMIVASFLTKDCLIDWREGAAWFWDCLVDADLASNAAGWQWTAGCGADAAPYFRVFNPTLQGQKFDPNGDYVTHWIPELKQLPVQYRHQPWAASPAILKAAGMTLDTDYPTPILNHTTAREQALRIYKERIRR